MPLYPNEMVPLQIDLAIGDGRHLLVGLANPGVRTPAFLGARSPGGSLAGIGCAPCVRWRGNAERLLAQSLGAG